MIVRNQQPEELQHRLGQGIKQGALCHEVTDADNQETDARVGHGGAYVHRRPANVIDRDTAAMRGKHLLERQRVRQLRRVAEDRRGHVDLIVHAELRQVPSKGPIWLE